MSQRSTSQTTAESIGAEAAPDGWRNVSRAEAVAWLVFVGTVAALTLLPHLGGRDLWGGDEASHAQAAREMLAAGRWWTITYLGQPPPWDKPPVDYWLLAGALRLLGPSAWSVCVPAAVAGILTALVTYGLGARLQGPRAGGLAGFVLATTFLFIYKARTAFVDVPLLACLTAAIAAGHAALTARAWRLWVVLASVCLAAGTALKGLVGLGLPLLVLAVGIRGALAQWRRLAVMAGLTLLWVVPLYAAFGADFTARFLAFDHLRRFFVAHYRLGGKYPWYFYGPVFLSQGLPWTVFLPAVCAGLRTIPEAVRRWRLPLAWCAITFLVLTVSANKREPYLLPVFPGFALLVGGVADAVLAGRAGAALLRWWRLGVLGVGAGLGLAMLALVLGVSPRIAPIPWGFGHLLLGALAVGVVSFGWRATPRRLAVPVVLLVVGASQVLAWQVLPAMNPTRSARAAAEQLRVGTAGAPVAVAGDVEPGVIYYLNLLPPRDAAILPAGIRQALRTGFRVLVARHMLPDGILERADIAIRARAHLDHSEYLVLSRESP